jgi:hypothetical protein
VLALRLLMRLACIVMIAYLILDLIDAVLDAGHLESCPDDVTISKMESSKCDAKSEMQPATSPSRGHQVIQETDLT